MTVLKPWCVGSFAERLNGRERREEITDDEIQTAKENGLVVIYGHSDDLVILAGAISDEVSAFGGTTFRFAKCGLCRDWDEIDHDDLFQVREFIRRESLPTIEVRALWCELGYRWAWWIETDGECGVFEIFDDGEPFCRGIVIDTRRIG
ncbi:hypothetical protein [Roseiconus lacunae]|uniref:Uncharacterized protein n=1 Tax=Roseiconus lacunae TaxID=2605694 RepID=A0ABT7PEM5_9BACT|nr:hypothetical protein [Roseiconus lacunae]MDM4014945.1 hypothetical protein [Roseiconus lacunae]